MRKISAKEIQEISVAWQAMAEARLPWTVIPVEQRDRYMSCLEAASQNEDIRPLARFIDELVKSPLPPRPDRTAWNVKI